MKLNAKLGGTKPKIQQAQQKQTAFRYYAPDAKEVFLAGTFNNWEERACAMRRDDDGQWNVMLQLAPGRYEYRFIVDGVWFSDQCPGEGVSNGLGSWNCVITI